MGEALSVVKLRLEADAETQEILDGQSRKCNWLYNRLLEEARRLRREYRESQSPEVARILYTKRGLRNLVPALKGEFPFLRTVHSSPLKNTALRLTESIRTHQKRRKALLGETSKGGRAPGWPRFRSWKARWFSLLYDEPEKGWRVEGSCLRLSLGLAEGRRRRSVSIRMPDAGLLRGKKIRNLRIVKECGVLSAVFSVERDLPETKPVRRVIALDPNHKNFAYGVDNSGQAVEIEFPSWLRTYDLRIDELKSLRDSCERKSRLLEVLGDDGNPTGRRRWEASRRWRKLDVTLERLLAKRRDQTKTFLYTVANRLYRSYDLVAIGDYTPHGGGLTRKMRRAMNNRSLIGRFKEVLSWVALKSGKSYEEFPERGTTRTCSNCGHEMAGGIPPAERRWTCPGCGTEHLRDENAAVNGLRRVLRNIETQDGEKSLSVPGSGHVSVMERWAWRVGPSGVHSTSRGTNCGYDRNRQEIKPGMW